MMIEDKLLHAMINAEMRSAYSTACEYARVYARFVGCKEIPAPPFGGKTMSENMEGWLKYYFDLLETIGKQITGNLIAIRSKYKEKNMDIPSMVKMEVTN